MSVSGFMKAAVLQNFGEELVFEEKPIPVPKAGEVLVKVRASGLCSSDLHIQDGMIKTVKIPYTPGHELAGEIADVGEGVSKDRIGEHIAGVIDICCGECEFCRSGRTNLCRSLVRIGFERDGSHEEYVCIPSENAVPVSKDIPFEQLTGIPDAVGCMYNALKNRAMVKPGQRVLIMGVGGLGMNAIQIAKYFGATVYATSRQQSKLDIALEMGADAVINTRETDLRTAVDELTGGLGVDAVLDNIGLEWSINQGIFLVKPGGKVIVVGYVNPDFRVDYQEVMKYEKEIIGMRGMRRSDFDEVADLVSRGILKPYVYKTIPFARINEGLRMLRSGEAKGRIVVTMQD